MRFISSWPGLSRPSTFYARSSRKTWMPGTSPGMTTWGRSAATSPFSYRIRIDDIGRRTGGIGGDLVENIRELDFVFLARDVAEVRRGDDVVHVEQRIAGIAQRLFLIDIHRRHAGPAGAQGVHQRVRFDQRCAAGVDQERGRLHA